MQKKLHSRRLDYDAKLAKVQKAKKEKPEWEEEMQAAKAKYEDTRECVLGIMSAISESQVKKKSNNAISISNHFHGLLFFFVHKLKGRGSNKGVEETFLLFSLFFPA